MADYLNYVLSNPDLRENAEALGLTQAEMKEWGKRHWDKHGSKEGPDGQGRRNSPTNITWESGYTETLGSQHYQGRDPNEVLQRSVRSFYQGADKDDYDMWQARENLNALWNLGQFSSEGWNLASDNPYKTGILGNNISVDTGVGQLYDTTDNLFLQDRYEDDSIANDFLASWVTDGEWTGPAWGKNYWNSLSTAERNALNELRATIARPNTGWDTTSSSGGDPNNPLEWVDPNISGSPSTASMLEFRPWEANYWATYTPDQMNQMSMQTPVVEPSMSYLPGEFRDPRTWSRWADDHKGHIPEGAWVSDPSKWPSYAHQGTPGDNPWVFTSPGGGTNIAQSAWNAPSLSNNAAQRWAGILAGLDTSPVVDVSTQTLLGV